MKIVAIMGSHRSHHNTASALDYFLECLGAPAVNRIDINQVTIKPCIACEYCAKHPGECVQQDDMTALYPEIMAADLIIMAAPVYFSAFPAKLKNFIDRGQVFFNLENKEKVNPKKVAIIALGGARAYDDQFISVYATMRWYQNDLKASPAGAVEIPNTDRIPFEENEEAKARLKKLADRVYP